MTQKPSQSRLTLRRSHAVRRVARSAPFRSSAISAIEVLTLLPNAAPFDIKELLHRPCCSGSAAHHSGLRPGVLRRVQQASAIDALQLALRDRDRALHVLAPG